MNRALRVVLSLLLVSALLAGEKKVTLRVSNRLDLDRPAELVHVPWSALPQKNPALTAQSIAVFEKGVTQPLVRQVLDFDLDGKADELIFQASFKAKETKEFVVKTTDGLSQQSIPLTDARFVTPREDLAWENDRIAFRMYGPALAKEVSNGIDVWTKRVRYLIVKKWYEGEEKEPKISYHEDHGEGADYFSVGRTLGVGASSLVKGDSLYQPGVFQKYRIIATGPLMAVFELTYAPMKFEGKNITQVVRISLPAGVNLNKIETTYSGDGAKGKLPLATGIVKRKGTTTLTDKGRGWIGLWGLTTEKEEIGYLGTGIVMPAGTNRTIKEDATHVLFLGSADPGKPTTYYAGAGWTSSGDFSTQVSWSTYLSEFAQKVGSPLVVKLAAN